MAVKTPVVLMIFNRADLTARVWEVIRATQPQRLFVIADGPRNPAERSKCEETRRVVEAVDWPCDVQRRYSETNLGCGHCVASGLDWVFAQADEAIILEDDCLPASSFFRFCERLLERYRDDERVMHISGNNFQLGQRRTEYSYYFSKYTHNWGWATWRRAWKHYDFEIKYWGALKENGMLQGIFPDPVESAFWESKLDPFYQRKRQDTWDYQWNCAIWTQGGVSILPSVNLVSNLGWRGDATHTREDSRWANLPTGEIGEIVHPPFMVRNHDADLFTFNEFFGGQRLRRRRSWRYRFSNLVRLFQTLLNWCSTRRRSGGAAYGPVQERLR